MKARTGKGRTGTGTNAAHCGTAEVSGGFLRTVIN